MISLFLKTSFCFPAAKSNEQVGRIFKEIMDVPRKHIETRPIILRTLGKF